MGRRVMSRPQRHSLAMAVIEVVLGDITVQDVDVIVTAANESLLGGGGVDRAIHRAASPRLAEAGAAIEPCDPGDAMATPAFDLDPLNNLRRYGTSSRQASPAGRLSAIAWTPRPAP